MWGWRIQSHAIAGFLSYITNAIVVMVTITISIATTVDSISIDCVNVMFGSSEQEHGIIFITRHQIKFEQFEAFSIWCSLPFGYFLRAANFFFIGTRFLHEIVSIHIIKCTYFEWNEQHNTKIKNQRNGWENARFSSRKNNLFDVIDTKCRKRLCQLTKLIRRRARLWKIIETHRKYSNGIPFKWGTEPTTHLQAS